MVHQPYSAETLEWLNDSGCGRPIWECCSTPLLGRGSIRRWAVRRRFILATLGTTALLATGPTAMAGKPEIQTIPVDFVDTIDCGGFALEGHVFGTIRESLHRRYPDGSARDISSIRLRHVVTNPQTGESLTSNDVGVDKVSIHPDGSATLMQVGLIRSPGHGYCVSAQSMREKLRLMEAEASNLTDVPLMDAERISGLKIYVDELLEETAALLTIFSGRLYTVSYCLSVLEEEDGAASRTLETLDIDQIDRILSDFRRIAEAFNTSAMPEWTVVLKGVQVARSLQSVLSAEHVRQLLDFSLVDRAQRRLEDFLNLVRGLQFLQTEQPGAVNEIIAELVKRTKETTMIESADLMEAVDDDQSFLEALTRRWAAYSPLRDIEFEFAPAEQATNANIGAERLDDILTNLMEGMAGMGVKHISIATDVASGQVEIRLSSCERMDPIAFGKRRLDLYNRTLGWLGGSLECIQHEGNAAFIVRLPALESI